MREWPLHQKKGAFLNPHFSGFKKGRQPKWDSVTLFKQFHSWKNKWKGALKEYQSF